jgi:hypothetical protein
MTHSVVRSEYSEGDINFDGWCATDGQPEDLCLFQFCGCPAAAVLELRKAI